MMSCSTWTCLVIALIGCLLITIAQSGQSNYRNDVIPDRSKCGFQATKENLVNVEDPGLEEFPWVALLGYQEPTSSVIYQCGGTLISPKYVLTVAHCLLRHTMEKLVTVRLGEWSTDTSIDCLTTTNCNQPPVDVDVESTIIHEEFDPRRIINNDIGLVRLKDSAPYTDFVRPICLPLPVETSQPGKRLFVSGFDRLRGDHRSLTKLKLTATILDLPSCNIFFKGYITDGHICASEEPVKDTYLGFSGAPLMRTSKQNTSQWYIEGITSLGRFSWNLRNSPTLYTNVSHYLDWIYSHVKP